MVEAKIAGTEEAASNEAVRPIVPTIEETSQKALYCSIGHTVAVVDMTQQESKPMIDVSEHFQSGPMRQRDLCAIAFR